MIVEVNTFDNLLDNSWGQAIDTLKMVDKYGLQEEFMEHMEELFGDYCEEPYTDTQINDYIAYEFDEYEWITEHISVDDLESLDELEDYASQLDYIGALTTIRDFARENKEELLWQYIQNNYTNCGCSLEECFEELADLSVDDLEEDE